MTISELISALSKYPGDRQVVLACHGSWTKLPGGEIDGDNLQAFDIEGVSESGPWDRKANAAKIDLWFVDPERETAV